MQPTQVVVEAVSAYKKAAASVKSLCPKVPKAKAKPLPKPADEASS